MYKRLTTKCFTFTLCLFLIHISHTMADEREIFWHSIHWPPTMILDENNVPADGRAAFQLNVLKKHMPEYKHSHMKMNWARVWASIKEEKQVCMTMALKKPERLKFASYSQPYTFIIPVRIIIRKDLFEKLGKPESISIKELMKSPGYQGLIEKDRSYTKALDKVLLDNEKGSGMKRSQFKTKNALKMLLANRIDYTIEYPNIAAKLVKEISPSAEIETITIKEIKPYVYSYVVCPKNDWGKSIIKKVNEVLDVQKPTAHYRKLMEMSAFTEKEVNFIRSHYDNHFLVDE